MPINESIFADLPAIPGKVIADIQNMFENYLFLEVKGRGVKHYTCSACGTEYDRGAAVDMRTVTERDVALWYAQHNDECECAQCGKKLKVINIKKRKIQKLNSELWFVIFLPVNQDRVWVRCINYSRTFEYNSGGYNLTGEWSLKEWHRYLLEPGKAEMYESYYSEWRKQKTIRDAFLWNHGFFCEKYPYYGIYCDVNGIRKYGTQEEVLDGTFLKYNSFYKYEGPHLINAPYMKYMCWYAIHPQIEMLVKTGKFEIVDRMILHNTDDKTTFDWSARTPWGLHRMDKQLYDAYTNHVDRNYGNDKIDILKTFNAIHGRKAKDFEAAEKINCMFNNTRWGCYGPLNGRKAANEYLTACKKVNVDPVEMYKYLDKYQKTTAGACHQCPGLSLRDIADMWLDYINMALAAEKVAREKNKTAKRKKNITNVNPMPKDLKEAHDAYLKQKRRIEDAQNRAEAAKRAAARLKEIKKEAKELEKKYPKVVENLSKVETVFEYEADGYRITVPEGITDILMEGEALCHCVSRVGSRDRYLDRIEKNESYLLFLRKAEEPDKPWYTLEVEPDGTIRQKRTINDRQDEGIVEAGPFLTKWQKEVSGRLTERERTLGKKSRQRYKEEQAELRRIGARVHYGELRGQLLADVLDNDLMINENESEATA